MKKIIALLFIIFNTSLVFAQNDELMESIKNNDIDKVKVLLRDGINLDLYNINYGMSPLMYAAQLGNEEIVQELLDFGAKDFDFAFYVACAEGYWNIAEDIMKSGASNYNIALSYAAIGGKLDIVEKLIDLGAKDLNPALVSACEGNHLEVVKYLIEKGANVNTRAYIEVYRNYKGAERKSPLTASTNIDIIKELVNAGATNLNEAIIYNAETISTNFDGSYSTDILNEYINLGADINSVSTNDGKTLLMYLIEKRQLDFELIKKVIELGADVNARDRNGNTVLIMAVMYEYEAPIEDNNLNKKVYRTIGTPINVIEELLKAGANPTDRNSYGNTAYRLAARKKRDDIIKLFDEYLKR
ncbi:ankyrin repeat domain-containing protein [Brachyspira hyodysenteriae]|uniref:ankyrin repeat domain-containing protein n=1 Tax=Brachyspira hyodysenteriae TaxID=159 RepID=UPI00063DC12E|nr:ankyrin repeat domain-containing protein [Brachyspira hyodysenteriae]KLI61208.1 ankyrin [Brachyspira hyodysenteriae]